MSFGMLMQQISIIFLEVLLGVVGVRCKVITARDSKFLSDFTMTFLVPCNILSCAALEGGQEIVRQLFLGIGIMLCFFIASTFVCQLIAKLCGFSRARTAILAGAAAMPNCGFVGMPMAIAILGSHMGTLAATAAMSAYNIWFFTYINGMFQKEKARDLRSLITPCNVATLVTVLMLMINVRMPDPFRSVCTAVGSCTTPIALMIVGVMLAQSDLPRLVKTPFLYLVSLLRGLVFPMALFLALRVMHLESTLALGLAILGSPPSGSLCAVLARRNDMEAELCGQAVAQSTLFMLVSMPLMLTLALKWF